MQADNINISQGSNISVVIIGQNEGKHVNMMLSALMTQLPAAERIWVLDRCTDDSEKILKEFGERVIKTRMRLRGRQTSHSRNLGFSKCNPENHVLFIDGDRYPSVGNLYELVKWPYDIGLLLLEQDDRLFVEYDKLYGTVHNGFYSCGVFIKRSALNKILKFQDGKIFRTDIQQHWGIEDVYLGDVCYHLRLVCDMFLNVRLHGRFTRNMLDSVKVIEERFKLRQKLNVKW
jgi:glycosyltransferase involved in cell wall biosynthesis